MSSYYHVIDTTCVNKKAVLSQVNRPENVTLNSPALHAMEDFTKSKPSLLSQQVDYECIRRILIDTRREYSLVEEQQGNVVGLLLLEDIVGLRSMRRANEYQQNLKELSARDLMVPIAEIPAITLANALHAKLGDIVSTLKRHPLNYLLVMDTSIGTLRGMFSAKKISALLQLKIAPLLQARSTAEMAQVINANNKS